MAAYQTFLAQIGYIVPAPAEVHATTSNVDDELAVQAGPQLGGAGAERPLRAERRQRPLGQPVRRPVRHRRHPGRRRRRERRWLQPGARRQGDCIRPSVPRPIRPAGRAPARTPLATPLGRLAVKLANGGSAALAKPAQLVGYQGDVAPPAACCW